MKKIFEFVVFIIKGIFSIAIVVAFGYGMFYALILAFCTAGLALILIMPLFLGLGRLIMSLFKFMWGDDKKDDNKGKKLDKEEVALMIYIKEAKSSGMAVSEIQEKLMNKGWDANKVNKELSKSKGK